jgi:hypothetical protein
MDEFDKKIIEPLKYTKKFDEQKNKKIHEEVIKMYTKKTKRAKYITWLYLIGMLGAIFFLGFVYFKTESVKTMLTLGIVILILHETTVLTKLWWWVYSSRNSTLEELKKIQLQISELSKEN